MLRLFNDPIPRTTKKKKDNCGELETERSTNCSLNSLGITDKNHEEAQVG
jgi:hypothetical protein